MNRRRPSRTCRGLGQMDKRRLAQGIVPCGGLMTVLSLTGKPRGWLTKQVLATADSVETVAELVDVWCRKGVKKKRLMEILRKNKHPLCGEWEANTRDGYAEVWTHCP